MSWSNRSKDSIACVCGRVFSSGAGFATHKRTCVKFRAQNADAAATFRAASGRPQEHREIASSLREMIEINAVAQQKRRDAEAELVRASEFATSTSVDLEAARAKAASIGLQGSDAASVEAIRAWLRAVPR